MAVFLLKTLEIWMFSVSLMKQTAPPIAAVLFSNKQSIKFTFLSESIAPPPSFVYPLIKVRFKIVMLSPLMSKILAWLDASMVKPLP